MTPTLIIARNVKVMASQQAKAFYKQYGFQTFQDAENKMFIIVADVHRSFG
ncbi:hypothetical protein [Gayadomonas joobiniege]|uniref:hypothetical protein n=1 Tax=Gayadomonas joobiniege TaxID=1234606 RepID=UPI00036EE65D